jgi:hypothetical protein
MNIKKLLAGGLAAITAGATIAFGAAAITTIGDYATTTDGTLSSPVIVIGDTVPTAGLSRVETIARTKDVLGAADIAAAVAGYATTTVSTGTGASVAVSGGADVSTVDNKLYVSSVLNKAKNTITATELPTLLAKGTVTVSGVAYEYDQYITLGSNPKVNYNVISAANILDPVVYLSAATATATPVYNTSVVFNKPLNLSDSHTQGKKITLFGSDYTIAANSGGTTLNYNPLILQGYGLTETLTLATPTTVTIGGTPYIVEATFIGNNQLLLKVEGVTSDTLAAGDSDVISGLDIYVKSILYSAVAGIDSMAVVSLGSEKVTLTNGEAVTLGTATTVDGTLVYLTGGTSGLSKLTVSVAAEDSTKGYIKSGTPLTDPVFGSFKLVFNGLTPDLTDASRDTVTVTAGNTQASVAFTDYRGNAKTLNFARIVTTTGTRNMNASATQRIVVIEGETINRNDLFVFAPSQESEFGHILKLASITSGTNAKFKIEDVVTGSSTTYNIESDGTTDIYIDGQKITVSNLTGGSSVSLDWGAAASNTTFPLIKLENGEYMAFVDNRTQLVVQTTYELPGNVSVYVHNQSLGDDIEDVAAGSITYTFENSTGSTALDLVNITDTSSGALLVSTFPAILIMQERDNSTTKDFIGIRAYERDTTNHYLGIAAPTFTDAVGAMRQWASDTYMYSAVNLFGTYVTRSAPAASGETVKVYYPDTQAVATIGVGANPTFSVGGVGTVEAATKITSPVSKLASEVSSTAPGADLILIGGPCANSLTATVMAADNVTCGNWPYTTGIIKEYTGAFTDGSKALVIAGTTADNTRSLCAQAMAGTVSYAV